jgi:imidazole glycerol-phosphate synthase subunit HisH
MNAPVVIVDYGLGNLRSVLGAVTRLGFDALISSDPIDLARASKLILPGVGAFGDGMAKLASRQLIAPLRKAVLEEQRPILGICLGAELMARDSDEFGHHQGLGWIAASVRRISPSDAALRVPHVGWNEVRQTRTDPLFCEVPQDALFYFVHSYEIRCDDAATVIATAEYGRPVTAAFRRGNICGTQFHPEKSQRHGLTLLGNFLRA